MTQSVPNPISLRYTVAISGTPWDQEGAEANAVSLCTHSHRHFDHAWRCAGVLQQGKRRKDGVYHNLRIMTCTKNAHPLKVVPADEWPT